MVMDTVTLDRFELVGPLGSGADYDVRAAVDRETGEPVVLKRPSPQTVSRQMHGPTEERTARALEAYERAGQHCEAVPRVIGVTEAAIHDEYFGEDLGQPYSVRVEERAAGIPLVGDPRSRILRVPIGLGQNLFALHPLALPDGVHDWPVQEQLLEAQEIYANAGYALLDLGPHNVFYSPGTGRIAAAESRPEMGTSGRRLGQLGWRRQHDGRHRLGERLGRQGHRQPGNLRNLVRLQLHAGAGSAGRDRGLLRQHRRLAAVGLHHERDGGHRDGPDRVLVCHAG